MTATIISLGELRSRSALLPVAEEPLSAIVGKATLDLWRRHDELLAIIEGLRQPALAAHARFGPMATSLEATAIQALVEVGLLIRQAEKLSLQLS